MVLDRWFCLVFPFLFLNCNVADTVGVDKKKNHNELKKLKKVVWILDRIDLSPVTELTH